MAYCLAEYKERQENEAYKVYVTDCIKEAQNNLATLQSSLGNPAKLISKRFYDIMHSKPEEKRTPEEIKAKFISAFSKG